MILFHRELIIPRPSSHHIVNRGHSRSHKSSQSPPSLSPFMHSVCDSVMPANHATFASEKRSFTKEGREGFDRDDQSPGLPSTSQSIGASLKRVVFDRYCDENGTSNNRLKPGRVVLALFDLNLFEDDSCDAESVGKLITDEVTDGTFPPLLSPCITLTNSSTTSSI